MISFQNVSFTYAESGDGGVVDFNLIISGKTDALPENAKKYVL